MAYVAQQPWIQNGSLKENVLFDRKFDKATYEKVLHACALEPDIATLSAGDMTQIGERVRVVIHFAFPWHLLLPFFRA